MIEVSAQKGQPRFSVWKFPLVPQASGRVEIEMPLGSDFLDVQAQHGAPCLWMLVMPEASKEKRVFWIVGTGHLLPETGEGARLVYRGTFQMVGGELVFHLFEEITPSMAALVMRS